MGDRSGEGRGELRGERRASRRGEIGRRDLWDCLRLTCWTMALMFAGLKAVTYRAHCTQRRFAAPMALLKQVTT